MLYFCAPPLIVWGSDGDDVVRSGQGNDMAVGDAGDDALYGGKDSDVMYGGDGDDQLYGKAGNDSLVGDPGNDSMAAGKIGIPLPEHENLTLRKTYFEHKYYEWAAFTFLICQKGRN